MNITTWIKNIDFLKYSPNLKGEMKRIREFGISIIMPHLSKLDDTLTPLFNAAEAQGIELHPWIKPVFSVTNSIKRKLTEKELAGQKKRFGTPILRDCLNNRYNLEKGLENISDFLNLYRGKIKGLHLDYVRNDNALFLKNYPCRCEACQEQRTKWLGHGTLTLKDMKNPAVIYKELEMRNKNITDYVRKVRALTMKKGIRLSLAARANYLNQPDIEKPPVYGLGPAVYEGQDWYAWAEEGLFDFICTMNYYTDIKIFKKVAAEHARLLKDTKALFYSGIGIESSIGKASPAIAENLLNAAAKTGAAGVSLFHYEAVGDQYKKVLQKIKNI